MAEVREGTVVDGRYRVLRRLGSGGMADVWCAEDTHLQRRVALKILHQRFAQDREFVERFRLEAENAGRLQHPNIVGVFDRGDFDGTYYIAMAFLEGRSLKELIDAGLSPDEVVAIVRQILEAARFAHRRGVIHRDFKPQNVIVDAEGKATVTDFGIARAGVSEITQTGSVMGTAHYLSPEQAQGLEVTAASDLYSIGVILYEALTGRVPFEGESAVAVALKQVSQSPHRPSALNPEVSPALDGVVMQALEKDPQRRFADAEAFIAALEAAQREPGVARPGTTEYAPPAAAAPAEEEERRRRRWWLVAAAVLLGILVGLGLTRDTVADVPQVTGDPLGVAVDRLQEDGYEVEDIRRVQRQAPRNQVLEQDPAGEASLDCGVWRFFCSKPGVTLTVSAGPGSARVPPVAGLTQEDASDRLERAGFEVEVDAASSQSVAEGVVISADPSGGQTARRGSAVTITVSTGPRLVTVPPLVGRSADAARQALRARGLGFSISREESDRPEGEVIAQSPSAGDQVEVGSTVALSVSGGVPAVAMPNLIGDPRSDAVAELRRLGLSVTVTETETDVEAEDGVVTDQFPPPGTELHEGDGVTIRVGEYVPPPTPPPPPPVVPEP